MPVCFRLGCTRDVFKCWQVQVDYEFVEGAPIYSPPWASLSTFDRGGVHNADYSDDDKSLPQTRARLYPNVRGCGYPPELNCELFYENYSNIDHAFNCYVSTMDTSIGKRFFINIFTNMIRRIKYVKISIK